MKGYAAYDRIQNTTEGPRQVEYRLLGQVTSALRAAKTKPDDRPGFYNALVWNKKVWDAFLCDLIDDRNQAAMRVLGKELAKGKKKLGIFYGAAHMPYFEKRLRDEYDLVPVSTHWLRAWDLELRERNLEDLLFRLLEESLK